MAPSFKQGDGTCLEWKLFFVLGSLVGFQGMLLSGLLTLSSPCLCGGKIWRTDCQVAFTWRYNSVLYAMSQPQYLSQNDSIMSPQHGGHQQQRVFSQLLFVALQQFIVVSRLVNLFLNVCVLLSQAVVLAFLPLVRAMQKREDITSNENRSRFLLVSIQFGISGLQ